MCIPEIRAIAVYIFFNVEIYKSQRQYAVIRIMEEDFYLVSYKIP